MSFGERLQEIREGFDRPFWVANISELFERLSYYAAFASLARYLHESLDFSTERAAFLAGLFGFVWFVAAFGGTVADRLGFRRALSLAYFILSCSYFLLGSLRSSWLAPVRAVVPLFGLALVAVILPAFGVALVKPSVAGTTARASRENVRSLGFSIYYTLVNIGGAAGPYLASYVHHHMSVENVFRVAALSVFLMFFAVLIFFTEPRGAEDVETPTFWQVVKNFFTVLGNARFMLFLLIFSGFWIIYWQEYIILPIYVHDYVDARADTELMLISGPLTVISLQLLVSYLTKRIAAFRAVILGTLISSLAWLLLAVEPKFWVVILTLVVISIGEVTQAPRYYEYISRLAPAGQQGTYMGFAFLPIGIGSIVGGWFGGVLTNRYAEVAHQPAKIWWVMAGLGVLTTVLMVLYDLILRPGGAGDTKRG